ncbi:MAG: hypothetical protein ABI333_27965 [bacterium]
MAEAMAENIIDLTSGLYRFMIASEETILAGRKAAAEAKEHLLLRARQLSQRFGEAGRDAGTRLSDRMGEISVSLRTLVAELDQRRTRERNLTQTWQSLGQQYEALLASIRQLRLTLPAGTRLEHFKPRNYWRNVFHVGMGIFSIALYELMLGRAGVLAVGGSILGLFIFMDVLRRVSPTWNERFVLRTFGKISRPGEAYRIPSATWYLAALLLGVIFLPQHAVELGAVALAVGDPLASLAGKRWGRVKLVGDKSYAGTGAFLLGTFVAASLFLWLVVPGVGLLRSSGIAAVLAGVGAAAELLSGKVRLDDNFSIPLAVGLVAALLL